MNERSAPKVSVCVVTYNQEKYIRQCLQSIVDQKTDFYFEVIVGDDCSTDGTQAIVKEFSNRYPGIIKPIFNDVNIGAYYNFVFVHKQAIGVYIAHMDGDDFMLPGKLKIQADALDNNPDCAICVHSMKQYDPHKQRYRKLKRKDIPRKSDITYLLMNLPFFNHSSKMYRAICNHDLLLGSSEIMDCYLHVHHALTGKILYLTDVLGVYRLNIGIASVEDNNRSVHRSPNPKLLKLVIDAIDYAGNSGVALNLVNRSKANIYFNFSYSCLMGKDFSNFKRLIKKSVETSKVHNIQYLFYFLSGMPLLLFFLVRLRVGLREII
jgi:glycosyltransferase involved in cell wall biosynthesis